jgi:hypothetical protein
MHDLDRGFEKAESRTAKNLDFAAFSGWPVRRQRVAQFSPNFSHRLDAAFLFKLMSDSNEENPRVFKGIWLPYEIVEADLTWMEKALWGIVSSLGRHDRPCHASNAYLAEHMQTTANTVAGMLSKLRNLGFIVNGSFDGRTREMLAVIPEVQTRQTLAPAKGSIEPELKAESSSIIRDRKVDRKGTCARFEPPSLENVQTEAARIGLPAIEAEKFFNYYGSNGWRVGRNPMRSWPRAMANWKLNVRNYGNDNGKTNPRPNSFGPDRDKNTYAARRVENKP